MIGYIFNSETREISAKICDVLKCNETTIKGNGKAKTGTGQYLITDLYFEEGDILPSDVVDKREEIPVLIEYD